MSVLLPLLLLAAGAVVAILKVLVFRSYTINIWIHIYSNEDGVPCYRVNVPISGKAFNRLCPAAMVLWCFFLLYSLFLRKTFWREIERKKWAHIEWPMKRTGVRESNLYLDCGRVEKYITYEVYYYYYYYYVYIFLVVEKISVFFPIHLLGKKNILWEWTSLEKGWGNAITVIWW